MKKIFIATPAHDRRLNVAFVHACQHLRGLGQYELGFGVVSHEGVAKARNTLAARFMASDFDRLFFVDSDIIFAPEQFARIAAFDDPIVCAPYAQKQPGPPVWCMNALPGAVPDARGLLPVRTAGTGFMSIGREVFARLALLHPQLEYIDRGGAVHHDFFSMGVVGREYLTEDWYFCERARAAGYPVLVDTTQHVEHEGLVTFPLSP